MKMEIEIIPYKSGYDDQSPPGYTDINLDFIIQNVDDTPVFENPVLLHLLVKIRHL